MKCTRCREPAEVQLRAHNAAFCRPCYVFFFRRQVERAIASERMIQPGERVLVCVSGGKDSLALWDVLMELGYDTTGFYLGQGIGEYSTGSRSIVEAFATSRGVPLQIVDLAESPDGLDVPSVAAATRRPACSACGTLKRHHFDRAALAGGFPVLATGHNLDDEAARLLGNTLRWDREQLARQHPVLQPTHPKFVRKVRPLFTTSEYETAVYAFIRGITYVVEECPNATGATQLVHKEVLNRLEAESPGTKMRFLREFFSHGQAAFTAENAPPPNECTECGMPSWATLCGACRLLREVATRRAARAGVPA